MTNNEPYSSAAWVGALALLIAAAGSVVLVAAEGSGAAEGPGTSRAAAPEPNLPFLENGRRLFARNCAACHGDEGRGGVPNLNYITDTVPALRTLAEKILLFDKEGTDELVKALEQNVPAEDWDVTPATREQLKNIRNVIRKGNPAGKKDPKGPLPPLQMSPWAGVLSDRDVDSIVAYLLTLQPWED